MRHDPKISLRAPICFIYRPTGRRTISTMNSFGWNGFDWLLIAILTVSVLRGTIRGFLRTVFSLAGTLAGLWAAGEYYESVARWLALRNILGSLPTARVVAFVAIAVVVVVGFNLVGRTLHLSARRFGLGGLDSMAGALLGLVRGSLIGVAILFAILAVSPKSPLIATSALAPYLAMAARLAAFALPGDLSGEPFFLH